MILLLKSLCHLVGITRLTMISNFCTPYRRMNLFSVLYIVFITFYVLMALLHNELEEETSFSLQKDI